MRKIFIICAMALGFTTASAQRLEISKKKTIGNLIELNAVGTTGARRISPVSYSPISRTPEGTQLTEMLWSSKSGGPQNGKVVWTEVSGHVPNIIVNGNKMYIQSPLLQFSSYATNWIEGTISGETVTFRTPQCYYIDMSTASYFFVTRLNAQGKVDESNTNLTFSYKNGELKQTDGGVLALTDEKGNFYGYAEANIEVTKVNEETVKLPAEAQLQSYLLSFSGGQQTAKVAFVGKDVYISDPVGVENAWMKGTLEGNKISIPTGQYMGSGSGYPLYLLSGQKYYYTETNALGQMETKTSYKILSDKEITFTYDATNGSFTSDQLILMNSAKDQLSNAYVAIEKPAYAPWTQVKATPADPEIQEFVDLTPYNYLGYYGSIISFKVPTVDVDGNFIAQEDIYYQICFDGTPLELYGTTMIPYYGAVSDSEKNIYITSSAGIHQIQQSAIPTKTISIQSFYAVGEEVSTSHIMTYELVDGKPVLVDGIDEIQNDAPRMPYHATYNLGGQRVGNTYKGIVIKNGKKIVK